MVEDTRAWAVPDCLYTFEGMFKLPKGHLNLVSKSALMRNIKPQLDDHLAKLPVQYTI